MTLNIGPLAITDPVAVPTYADGPVSRWCGRHLVEARDEIFVRLTLATVARMSALMVVLYGALYVLRLPPLLVGAAYLAIWGWTVPPAILMLHCTMHRPFIRSPRWLNRAQGYAMTFFLGIPPAYPDHHLGMHHAEDNMREDLSSTIRYRRDSFVHFLAYFLRFFLFSYVELSLYLHRHGRRRMMRRMLVGEIGQIALVAGMCWVSLPFGLIGFALPTVLIRFMMMAGNWGQHAFINTERPNDGLSNSITCINSTYNRRCFNDGYHIGHHLKANRHWAALPQDFVDSRDAYVAAGAIVFERLDFFLVSLLLWTGQWRTLARRYVRLDGVERTDDEVIEMLKARVQPVREWKAAAMAPAE
jgi:fatty acid desaturase